MADADATPGLQRHDLVGDLDIPCLGLILAAELYWRSRGYL
jgi:hypothetical protein